MDIYLIPFAMGIQEFFLNPDQQILEIDAIMILIKHPSCRLLLLLLF